jgi:MYXO-CTERM domain-containing protein
VWTSLPASYPGVTAVGGTQFAAGSFSGTPYFTAYSTAETTWNEGFSQGKDWAGGGGVSMLFSRPSWQNGLPNCAVIGGLPVAGVTAATQRQVPDVAFTAAGLTNGVVPLLSECTLKNGDCSPSGGNPHFTAGGGTSFASPAFSGVVALMQQAAGGRIGNINPLLYNLGTTTPSAFHDITTGNNEVACTASQTGCPASGEFGYAAAMGYDCATGLGSLDVYNAVAAVAGQAATTTTLAINPTSTTEGTPVAFTATVAVPTPNANALGGVVTFAFESYDEDAGPDLSWTLGTGTITGGTTAGGTATFTGAVPPGLVKPGMQFVHVYAAFGGDATHLPSVSPSVTLSFGALSFAIVPAAPTTMVLGKISFSTTGGATPVKWFINTDNTCNTATPQVCSTIDEHTGAFVAGPVAGVTQIQAIDANGEEQLANVTVGCTPATTCPAGQDCGAASDGCGGMIACGTCTASQTCTANQCVGGTSSSSSSSTTSSSSTSSGAGGAGGASTTSSSSSSSSTTTSSSGAGGASSTSASSSSSSSGTDIATKSGCSCTTAGDASSGPESSLSAFGLLAFAGVFRSRRKLVALAA